ncbi:PE-PGRS family protein [Streptomyces sp. LN785]|uniref:PE-PGRS family protein n=1 Tax=Streptomyces sp. LN785 TaxID=3112983 RepID=UPI003713383F
MTNQGDGYAELLRRAGLEVVGDGRDKDVVPPSAAWRPVAAFDAAPAVAVREDRPDLVAEVNAQWHRLATEHGVIGGDGVFLVHTAAGAGRGRGPRRWTRVRLTGRWDLAGVLADRPGRPEFITVSVDGVALLGVTSEEYETWLVAVDGVKERLAEGALSEAQETSDQCEAAWAAFLRKPRPPERLREAWIDGLQYNRAAPDEVLIRLLGTATHLLWRKPPAAVVDAAVNHPDRKVRARAAESPAELTSEQWTRLVLNEPGGARRVLLAELAADRGAELTDAGYERLATSPDPHDRAGAARFPGLPERLLTALAADPDPRVRSAAAPHAWPHLAPRVRDGLLADPDGSVRTAALFRHYEDHPMPRSVYDGLPHGDHAAQTYCLDQELAEQLSVHPDPSRRRALAANPHLTRELVAVLAGDPDDDVRLAVSVRPELTEEQRASIRVDIDPHLMRRELPWIAALHDDPEAMRRCATSSHLLLRSGAARARRLPPDVVELLARDEDRVVRLFLAESCDDAPAELLLEVWRWWSGSFTYPDRPRGHPNFPRRGLLRHAADPDPRMRQLALDDPESTADLVERFSRDSHQDVRHRAATDPRLSPASAVRLLDDPRDSVRDAAARHPRLPARTVIRLLRDAATAGAAVTNPALPVPVMLHMLGLAATGATQDGSPPGSGPIG